MKCVAPGCDSATYRPLTWGKKKRRKPEGRKPALRRDLRVALMPFGQWGQILTHMRAAETVAAALGNHRHLGRIYGLIANAHRNMQAYEPALAYCLRPPPLRRPGGLPEPPPSASPSTATA